MTMLANSDLSTLHPLREPCILNVLLFHLFFFTPFHVLRVIHFNVSRAMFTFCSSSGLLLIIFWWYHLTFIFLQSRFITRWLWITRLTLGIFTRMRDYIAYWFTSFISLKFLINQFILLFVTYINLYDIILIQSMILTKLNFDFVFDSPNLNCLIIPTRNEQIRFILIAINLIDNISVSL